MPERQVQQLARLTRVGDAMTGRESPVCHFGKPPRPAVPDGDAGARRLPTWVRQQGGFPHGLLRRTRWMSGGCGGVPRTAQVRGGESRWGPGRRRCIRQRREQWLTRRRGSTQPRTGARPEWEKRARASEAGALTEGNRKAGCSPRRGLGPFGLLSDRHASGEPRSRRSYLPGLAFSRRTPAGSS